MAEPVKKTDIGNAQMARDVLDALVDDADGLTGQECREILGDAANTDRCSSLTKFFYNNDAIQDPGLREPLLSKGFSKEFVSEFISEENQDDAYQRRFVWLSSAIRHFKTINYSERQKEKMIQQLEHMSYGNSTLRKRAFPLFINALKDGSWKVRKAALEALDDEDKKVITEVIKLLNDRKDEVRLAAIKKLRQFCDKKAIPALKQALKDENREIRDEARYALSLIVGGKGCASTDDLD